VNDDQAKRYGISLACICLSAAIASTIWKVAYVYTCVFFVAPSMFEQLIATGFARPRDRNKLDDRSKFQWHGMAIKTAILLILVGLAISVPPLRRLGT